MKSCLWMTALFTLGSAGPGAAQRLDARDDLVLDHLFVFVPAKAEAARQALTEAGINVGSTVVRHEGSGTASIFAMFENAYLELAWVDSSVPSAPEFQARLQRNQRASAAAAKWAESFRCGPATNPECTSNASLRDPSSHGSLDETGKSD